MNRQAVLLAREIMEAVPEELVNMRNWQCRTQACLLGHMALSGKFDGLVMTGYDTRYVRPKHLPTGAEAFSAGAEVLEITFEKAFALFGVPCKDELRHFYQDGPDHKALAIARLDALLAKHAVGELAA